MPHAPEPTAGAPHARSALFVDFDNIYLRIQQEDPRAAEQFATNPAGWLAWLCDHLPADGDESAGRRRRKILFRRCYLNPVHFGRFRPDFSRAAFEVVDCPPLTSGGKTSSDIHMVMDILDLLQHETRFDEFIILSGDADFTPVLLRLSMHDRRSTVLAVGPASAAYKAACDHLIDEDTFLEEAVGVGHAWRSAAVATGGAGGPGGAPSPMDELLGRIADKVYERASTFGELVATDLPGIYREFPEFTASTNWLGFRTLRQMTWAVTRARPDLAMIDGDPWKVRVRLGAAAPAGEGEEGEAGGPEEPVDAAKLAAEVLEHVRSVVTASDSAVPMARMAQLVIGQFGEQVLRSSWAGAGTFRDLLSRQEEPSFAVSPHRPGYIYDPSQHQVPVEGRPHESEFGDPDLATLAYRVHQLTDTPYLTPDEYALAFRLIAEEVNEHGYFLHRTSKAVRDRCHEEGWPIPRMSINFILRGITFAGHRLGAIEEDAGELGRCFAKNVLVLCENAGLQLDEEAPGRIREWIAGRLEGDAA